MKFSVKHLVLDKKSQNQTFIIPMSEKGDLSPASKKLDEASLGFLKDFAKKGDFSGKIGQCFLLPHLPHTKAAHVLLVGTGKDLNVNEREFRKMILQSSKALQGSSAKEVVNCLSEVAIKGRDTAWKVKQIVEVSSEGFYRYDAFKSVKAKTSTIQSIAIHIEDPKSLKASEKALSQAKAIADAVSFTKNLGNLPSNLCTPTYLANEAKKLAKAHRNMSIKILDEAQMKKLGMGAFLAVTQGSEQEGKMICLEYKGSNKKSAPIALVGKGITFDTGGLSLKPADSMVGMKYDMCGAASVLGTMKSIAELKLPLHVIGILATAENMPSGHATKPEDIVTSLSGQTIEIMNTDAEGRLVLCDALTYCERYKPEIVIDIATLTGAVVVALGHHASAMLSNNDELADDLLKASHESQDRIWQMPLWDDYQEQLNSPFADMSNVGGRYAGTITAACFLSRFAKKFKWAHLDVAGTAAMMGGNDRYSTGRPVPLLVQYLIQRSEKRKA